MCPPPYIMRKPSTCTSSSGSLCLWSRSASSSTPSKTLSNIALRPKVSMALPDACKAFASASGLSSSSRASSASVRLRDSMQQETMTTLRYALRGAAKVISDNASWTLDFSNVDLKGLGAAKSASRTSPSTVSTSAAACAKSTPEAPAMAFTDSKLAFSSLVRSAKQRSADSTRALLPDSLRAFKICSSTGKISAFAFGPLCSFSFHRSVAILRTSCCLSVRAMNMDASSVCRCHTDRQSMLRKSCPNFMPSLIFSQRAKKRSMARPRESSSSKKRDSCMRGSKR
mmetsp:Transcript_74097/g.131013  ORF Transcript_74097/g.131013 Transcript_74097/m.131013 type:complete len:285 (+) Transcript_74097:1806-2660(+)